MKFHVKQMLISLSLLFSIKGFAQQMMMFKDAKIPHPATIDYKIDNWNKNQSNYNQLSAAEREFYYWVNYSHAYPQAFFDSVVLPITFVYPQLIGKNLESLKRDLYNAYPNSSLSLSDTLLKTSNIHAKDITTHNSNPSHNSTNGESFIDRFKKAGLKNCGSENISFSGGDGNALFILVMLYLDINVPDLGHRKTLLNPDYLITGIAISKYKNGNTFLVEDFACKQN